MASEKSSRKMTECICPSCRRKHKKLMDWKGRGIPYKYCSKCTEGVSEVENPDINFQMSKQNKGILDIDYMASEDDEFPFSFEIKYPVP